MPQPIANARMYSATPQLRADWKALLQHALREAELSWETVDYDAPAPLNALWAREDLGLVLMCGLPFAQRRHAQQAQALGVPRAVPIAVPVPSPARYQGRPVYFSDIVVRADAPYQKLEDTFGGTVGYTLADSMSGGVAWRDHLAPYREQRGGRLYRRAVGNLIHARGVIEALVSGAIDVGPLDSYYHDLLRHNEPAFAAQVRTVASTAARPMPLFVATAELPEGAAGRLLDGLRAALDAPALQAAVQRLLLADFRAPEAAPYDLLAEIATRPHPAFEEL